MSHDVDLILPCYNPPEDFAVTVFQYFTILKDHFRDREINLYVVNDGSERNFTDKQISQLLSIQKSVHIISYSQNKGKGYAVREAVSRTKSNLIVYTDYDFPYHICTMIRVIEELDRGADVVQVSRNSDYLDLLSPKRKLYSLMSMRLNRCLLNIKYCDTQGGLKGFNRKGRDVFMKTTINEFLFDTEFIYRASVDKNILLVNIQGMTRKGIKPNYITIAVIKRELINFSKILKIKYL